MRELSAVALLLLMVLGCGEEPVDRLVMPDGQVVVGRVTSIDGSGVEIAGLVTPAPTGDAARVTLTGGATYTGVITSDGTGYTLSTDMGQMELKADEVASIYWPPTEAVTDLVDVPANGGWYNTHLAVEDGMVVRVIAAGKANVDTGLSGPEGQDQYSSALAQVTGATSGQLVMRVGTDNTPVAVGKSWQGPVEGSGEVYLAVNSPPDSAVGYYTVSLVLEEPAGRGHWALYPSRK
jgi:hypothetical protein